MLFRVTEETIIRSVSVYEVKAKSKEDAIRIVEESDDFAKYLVKVSGSSRVSDSSIWAEPATPIVRK